MWNTRFATSLDQEDITDLLMMFAEEAQIGFRSARRADRDRMRRCVQAWTLDHYVRVVTRDHQVVGMIIAERGPDFWDPERVFLVERAWYMHPGARATRGSVLLWRAWTQDVDHYIESGLISAASMSTQGTTGVDLRDRGWCLVENHWIRTR